MDLNPKKNVIEVLEDVVITPVLITCLREFKQEDFKITLDDFVLQSHVEVYDELFRVVDFLNTTQYERKSIRSYVKAFPHIILLAERRFRSIARC